MAILVALEVLTFKSGPRWTRKTYIGFTATLIACACLLRISRYHMCSAAVLIFCARNCSLKTLFKISVVEMSLVLTITMLAAHFGLIQNAVYGTDGTRLRQCLGFRYPLYPSMLIFEITALTLYLADKEEADIQDYCIICAILLLCCTSIFLATDSRLSFGMSLFVVLLAIVAKIVGKKHAGLRKAPAALLATICILSAIIAIGITVSYDPKIEWMSKLNTQLSGRLQLGHDGIETYGISLIGQKVKLVANSLNATGQRADGAYNFIDCVYVQYIVIMGVVYFLIFMVALTLSCYKSFRAGAYVLGILLIAVALHGMIDNLGEYLWYNPMMLSFSVLLKDPEPITEPYVQPV